MPHRKIDLSDETIASTGDVDYVAVAVLAIAQSSAQRRDVDRQIGLHHYCARPDTLHKFFFADQLARPLH